jgi:large-conductance mechanosensitive channel
MAIFVAIKAMNKLKRNEPAPAPEAPRSIRKTSSCCGKSATR